jgi:MinD-like ATPase involved in chromosome partitioning or flagellar assembly
MPVPVPPIDSPSVPTDPGDISPAQAEKEASRSKAVLEHLEFVGKYLPQSIRTPLLWIAATLLALPVVLQLFRVATGQADQVYAVFLAKPAAVIIVAAVLGIVLLAGAIEALSRRHAKHIESARYAKRVAKLSDVLEPTSDEDSDVLAKDSVIVEAVQQQEKSNRQPDRPHFESRIIAVISGKGGVGKSLLSLGLLEDFSRYGNVLLVDFDLHNRGLTSLLLDSFPQQQHGYVINLLKDFLNERDLGDLLRAYSVERTEGDGTSLPERFRKLNLKYSGVEPHAGDRVIQALGMNTLPQGPSPRLKDPLNAGNAFFLPSIPLGGSFLGSKKIRDASEDAAFLFFKALSYRARTQNVIQNLIVDCHGAHDLYTVGLIRAATDLVIVTTPDMGSLEGTRELVRFGKSVTFAGGNNLPRSVLVVNRCLENDPNAKQLADKWKEDLNGGVIRIEKNDDVERVARNYLFGSLAAKSEFWQYIEEIKNRLRPGRQQPSRPLASPPELAGGEQLKVTN